MSVGSVVMVPPAFRARSVATSQSPVSTAKCSREPFGASPLPPENSSKYVPSPVSSMATFWSSSGNASTFRKPRPSV